MSYKTMGRCIKTQFDRVILCAGTMTDWIEIVKRELQTTEPGYNGDKQLFTSVVNYPGRLEAVKYVPRFDGVNVMDMGSRSFTHVIYIPFDQTVYELDLNTLYVKLTRTRDRLFKLTGGIKDVDEQEQWLELALMETGFSDLEATEG